MSQYASYASLRRARSAASLRSGSAGSLSQSLLSSGSNASLGGVSVGSSRWEEHVKTTVRRNERIRLQSEATKLRAAFVQHDDTLQGVIPAFLLRTCLKSGGVKLPDAEVREIFNKFQTHDHKFHWLKFCESLERADAPPYHPKAALNIQRPKSASNLSSSGSLRNAVSSAFLASKQVRHLTSRPPSGRRAIDARSPRPAPPLTSSPAPIPSRL